MVDSRHPVEVFLEVLGIGEKVNGSFKSLFTTAMVTTLEKQATMFTLLWRIYYTCVADRENYAHAGSILLLHWCSIYILCSYLLVTAQISNRDTGKNARAHTRTHTRYIE